jgi:hypothetical protein
VTSIQGKDDLMPAQEKLEWVTPKISLMGAEETEGSKPCPNCGEGTSESFTEIVFGPS